MHIAAPPGLVWDLVSDVTRIGEFSPETFEAQWLDGATGPRAGARYRGHVRRTGAGRCTGRPARVTADEPGRESFSGGGPGWRHRNPGGTGRARHRLGTT